MTNAKLMLWIAAGSLLAACFQANKPLDSTQTGNPPVIDTARVALYLTSDELRVIGEPGAVDPGGAKVEVTNLRTGKSFTTQAADDGSFDVEVAGSETDAYGVRAKSEGRASAPVFVIRGNAAVGDGRDGSLSCEQRNTLAGELLTQAAKTADRSCKADTDCAAIVAGASCYAPACWFAYVSERGNDEIEGVSREIDANLCADYETDSCSHPLPKCATPPAAVCAMGQCTSAVATAPTDSCVVCLENELNWQSLSQTNGRIVDSSRAIPCASYTRYHYDETTGEERRCETPLQACNAITSTGAISTAVADPDVQQLLAEPESTVIRGNARERGLFQVMIGKKWIELHGSCDGAPPDCVPVPPGLEKLRELLQQIDHALASDMGPCDGVED